MIRTRSLANRLQITIASSSLSLLSHTLFFELSLLPCPLCPLRGNRSSGELDDTAEIRPSPLVLVLLSSLWFPFAPPFSILQPGKPPWPLFFSCAFPHRSSAASNPFVPFDGDSHDTPTTSLSIYCYLSLSVSALHLPLLSQLLPLYPPSSPLTCPPLVGLTVLFAPRPINHRQSWSLLCERLHRRYANASFVRLRSERWPQATFFDTSLFPFSLFSSNLLNLLLLRSPPICPIRWPVEVTQALSVTITRFVWPDFASQTLPPRHRFVFQSACRQTLVAAAW